MTDIVTQTFQPGPRLIDGSDLMRMIQQINAGFSLDSLNPVITNLTTVGAGTLTAAGLVGGVIARGGAQAGAAFTDTTASAAAIISAMGGTSVAIGTAFFFTYKNTTNAQATLAAGSGVTLSGNLITPLLSWSTFVVTKTSATAVTAAYVQSGTLYPLAPYASTSQENTGTGTINVAGLTSAQISTLVITPGSLKAMVTPTAADIIAALANAQIGMNTQVNIQNGSTVTLTITGLTGVQVAGLTRIMPSTTTVARLGIPSPSSADLTGLTNTAIAI